MEIQEYLEQKRELHSRLLSFIDSSNAGDHSYEYLIKLIKIQGILGNREELGHLLGMIKSIFNNHHRQPEFFHNIKRILHFLKDEIKQSMSNIEIFNFFDKNKLLILILIEEEIITLDQFIIEILKIKTEKNGIGYSNFFIPEINKITNSNITVTDDYEKKRHQGENDSYICSLIRQDLVEEFISYVNRENISLKSIIAPSIFETNPLLNERQTELVEYAAFFGSIQIFQYLYMSKIKLKPYVWIFGVHSNNSILIVHHIEGKTVSSDKIAYERIYIESIKCHHNEIANYIDENLIKSRSGRVFELTCKYYNYNYFPNEFKTDQDFFELYRYNHLKIINFILEKEKENIESKIDGIFDDFVNKISN